MADTANNQSSDATTTQGSENDVKETGSKTFTNEELGQKLSDERRKLREQYESLRVV